MTYSQRRRPTIYGPYGAFPNKTPNQQQKLNIYRNVFCISIYYDMLNIYISVLVGHCCFGTFRIILQFRPKDTFLHLVCPRWLLNSL